MRKNKLLLLLALLMTAATGAWATTPNSIVINGTPQVGDKSISLTYHFDPNNVTGLDDGYAPTLKVKCAADNKWDETSLSSTEVSSGTTSISLSNLGEFEAGKTYEVCFAYNNGNWVDDVFQSFVPATAGGKYGVGASYQFSAEFTPAYVTETEVTWSVDDPTIATISEDGVLTPLKNGTVTIICTSKDNAEATASITIEITGGNLPLDEGGISQGDAE